MKTDTILHITSGDCAGDLLSKSNISGDVFVWHDIMYDGPRNAGWPSEETLKARSEFLEVTTGKGLKKEIILDTFKKQYQKLIDAGNYKLIVLWFDACLFDQSMLVHILTCLRHRNIQNVELLCVDTFPGIKPYNGLGQLSIPQIESVYIQRQPVTDSQYAFAKIVDQAFATKNLTLLAKLATDTTAAIKWIPAAASRWLQEQPDPITGLGKLEQLALNAIRKGKDNPVDIFVDVAMNDTPPQFWGDTTLWEKINTLADHTPPFIEIKGPISKLPQWESKLELKDFKITAVNIPQTISSISLPKNLKILVLAPHPDDFDAIGVTLNFFQGNGNSIEVAVARTGSGVEDEYKPGATISGMADIRETEQRNSLHFFGLPTQCLTFMSLINDDSDQLIDNQENLNIIEIIVEEKIPDIIFLPHGNDTNSAHQAMYSMLKQIAKRSKRPITAFLSRDPKTINMRTDLYMPFNKEEAEWKAEMLRFHDSQHQRNLRSRGHGFDDRILDYNRQIACDLSLDAEYAEAFEVEIL